MPGLSRNCWRTSSTTDPAAIRATLLFLREKGFEFLASVHGLDYYPEEPRLGVQYELLSMADLDRITQTFAQVQAGAEPHMIVLDPAAISLYKMTAGRWTPEQQFAIPHAHAWPRDIRGRLVLARDHLFDAYLPGVVCTSTAKPPLTVNCRTPAEIMALAAAVLAEYAPDRQPPESVRATGEEPWQRTVPAIGLAAVAERKLGGLAFGTNALTQLLGGKGSRHSGRLTEHSVAPS